VESKLDDAEALMSSAFFLPWCRVKVVVNHDDPLYLPHRQRGRRADAGGIGQCAQSELTYDAPPATTKTI